MRIIAFVTDAPPCATSSTTAVSPRPHPASPPARGPPLWEATGAERDPSADPLFQSAPAFEFDQRPT
jgi:hypothetical protein